MKFLRSLINRLLGSKLYSRIFKNLSISLMGMAGGLVLSLGRVSFLTKNLSVADYGKILTTIVLFNFLINFLEIRVQDVLFRYYPLLKKENKTKELLGIIWICVAACLLLGLLMCVGLFVLSDWIAITIYEDPVFGLLIKIYSFTALATAFASFYTAILRINNRFSSIVVPDITGSAIDLILIILMRYGFGYLTVEMVVYSTSIGLFTSRIPPLISAFRLIGRFKPSIRNIESDVYSLKPMAGEVKHMFFHSNIAGYLKLTEDGGGFLLSVLSTPTQVALFGLASKLIKPLNQLKNNIQTAITPEVHTLYAHKEYTQLNQLIKRFVVSNLLVGLAFLVGVILFIKPFIVIFAKSEYLDALPNLYIQLATLLVIVPCMVFFPLTVTMNQIKRLNIAKSISFIYLGVTAYLGMNAVTLAIAKLLGATTNKVFSDFVIYKRFLNEKKQYVEAKTLKQ